MLRQISAIQSHSFCKDQSTVYSLAFCDIAYPDRRALVFRRKALLLFSRFSLERSAGYCNLSYILFCVSTLPFVGLNTYICIYIYIYNSGEFFCHVNIRYIKYSTYKSILFMHSPSDLHLVYA